MFEKIYGNEYPKKLIESMIKKDKLMHTIILSGDKGLGKLTFAKEIALEIVNNKDLLTKNINIDNYIDINIIDGNLSGSILINDIREIKNKINISPHEGQKKVQIISNCDKMTIQAQNALLKSLEEPSKTTVFILTTSNNNKLLETILSRAMIINMEKISDDQALKILSEQYSESKLNEINRCIKIFNGNIGLIKSILDKPFVLDECEDLLFNIIISNEYDIMRILSKYISKKPEFAFFIEIFKLYFGKILNIYLSNKSLKDIIKNHDINHFTLLENKIYSFKMIDQSLNYLSANVNLGLIVTWLNSNLININQQINVL